MSSERNTCRDFERGVCNRGDNCKYFHPENVDKEKDGKLPICKDFQNRGCDRVKCKFLHITVDEEAEYNKSGTLPEHGGRPVQSSNSFGDKEICKDFLKGICDRGGRCRFMHVSDQGMSNGRRSQLSMYGKRRYDGYDMFGGGEANSSALMEENEMLKRKITDLQKQVLELRQMNDTLYDQNTRYRNQLRGGTAAAGSGTTGVPYNSPAAYAAQPTVAAVPAMTQASNGYSFPQY